jgi:hypothetical protein
MNTIIFILICYGACNNIIYGSLFEGFQKSLSKLGLVVIVYIKHTFFMCLYMDGFMVSGLLYFFYANLTPME